MKCGPRYVFVPIRGIFAPMRINAILPAVLGLSILSCATDAGRAAREYPFAGPGSGAAPTAVEDLNGFLPAAVYIKTRTQTFCRDYQFCVVDGRVYYKTAKSRNPEDWRLLDKTGLPRSSRPGFRAARRVVEISADAYKLYALSDEGRLYELSMERGPFGSRPGWIDRHGWPDKAPLVLNDLVGRNRAWSASVRNEHALWYEDVAGNQHYYGSMGVVSFYFLSEDGREIRFADPGLPSDFSHHILGPERGSFVAESLAASASTLFVIDDAGVMYTRLADFDTLGYDPMFFKYSYDAKPDDTPGSDPRTETTTWALPAEGWRRQEPIPLSGAAAVGPRITILQDGYGNAARELRVAGLSPDGEPGYYYKGVFEPEWRFMRAPLRLGPDDLFDPAGTAAGLGSRGPRLESALAGSMWLDGGRVDDVAISTPDFSVREGGCSLELRAAGGEEEGVARLALYPVDMWTYMRRYDPGLDGTPKLMYFTLVFPDDAFVGASERLERRTRELLGPLDRAVFACRGEATEDYLHVELPYGRAGSSYLFLYLGEAGDADKDLLRRLSLVWPRQVDRYLSDELVLDRPGDVSVARRSEVEAALERNLRYRDDIEAELELYRSYMKRARLARWGYSTLDFFSTITLVKNLEGLRLGTVASHGDEIMAANEQGYRFTLEAKEWTYEKLLELLDLRVEAYRGVIADFDAGRLRTGTDAAYRETFSGYYDAVGLPGSIAGATPDGRPGSVYRFAGSPLFPALVLSLDPASPGQEPTAALVELEGSAARIYGRKDPDLARAPLVVQARLHVVLNPEELAVEDAPGRLEWDGETLRLWKSAPGGRVLLFEGRVGP